MWNLFFICLVSSLISSGMVLYICYRFMDHIIKRMQLENSNQLKHLERGIEEVRQIMRQLLSSMGRMSKELNPFR